MTEQEVNLYKAAAAVAIHEEVTMYTVAERLIQKIKEDPGFEESAIGMYLEGSSYLSGSRKGIQESNPREGERRIPFTSDDVGQVIEVKVTKLAEYGAFCYDSKGRSGLLPKRNISSEFVEDVKEYLRVGDTLRVKVIQDRKNPSQTELSAKAVGDIRPLAQRQHQAS